YESAERQQSILELYSRGDVYLLGRTTYEMLWPFWSTQTTGDGPGPILNRMHKYVVSTTLSTAPWKESTVIRGNVVEAITTLKQQPGKDMIIDGSASLVHSLMGTSLIDHNSLVVWNMPSYSRSGTTKERTDGKERTNRRAESRWLCCADHSVG